MWNKYYISLIIQCIILIFTQVIVLNSIRLFGYFLPIIYLYPFLKMPIRMPQWSLMLLGFIMGLMIDALMNTPGINCAAITAALYFRVPILEMLVDEDDLEENETMFIPSFKSMKVLPYISYLFLCATIHIGLIMLLEAFSTQLFYRVVPYILGSTAISLLIFVIFDLLHRKK